MLVDMGAQTEVQRGSGFRTSSGWQLWRHGLDAAQRRFRVELASHVLGHAQVGSEVGDRVVSDESSDSVQDNDVVSSCCPLRFGEAEQPERPIVAAGDFNAVREHAPMRTLLEEPLNVRPEPWCQQLGSLRRELTQAARTVG